MDVTGSTRFIVMISQLVAVLGATNCYQLHGFKKRILQPFVCTAPKVSDSGPVVDITDRMDSDRSITSVTNHDNPVSMSTRVREKGGLSTTFISSSRSTRQSTYNVATQLSGFSEITSATSSSISDPTTALITIATNTTIISTTLNNTTDSLATSTNEFTSTLTSDPSTVGFTSGGTTYMSSTEESTQGTTDASVTVQTTGPASTPVALHTIKATCPFNYSAIFNNSCYRISKDTDPILSRSDARKLCESESAHLAFIESKEEDAFLINIASSNTQYWIGANGLPDEFYWDDGSKIEFKPLSKQNIAFDDLRGCYRMKIKGNESTWPDAPCLRKYNYICEYNLERRTQQCPDDISMCTELGFIQLDWDWEHAPELTNSVPAYFDGKVYSNIFRYSTSLGIHHLVYRSNDSSNNWCSFRLVTDYRNVNQYCMTWNAVPELNTSYTLVTNWLRWDEASKACIFYDSNLVTVDDEEENTWLQSFISSTVSNAWIGLSFDDGAGEWQWQRRNSTNRFFNWGDGQPNSLYSCTILNSETAKWTTKSCHSAAPFLCERSL